LRDPSDTQLDRIDRLRHLLPERWAVRATLRQQRKSDAAREEGCEGPCQGWAVSIRRSHGLYSILRVTLQKGPSTLLKCFRTSRGKSTVQRATRGEPELASRRSLASLTQARSRLGPTSPPCLPATAQLFPARRAGLCSSNSPAKLQNAFYVIYHIDCALAPALLLLLHGTTRLSSKLHSRRPSCPRPLPSLCPVLDFVAVSTKTHKDHTNISGNNSTRPCRITLTLKCIYF